MPLRRAAGVAITAGAVLFAAVNGFNALNKGGDAQVFFEGGRRLLLGSPLYDHSGPAAGFIGPPFQAVFFAPFAALQRASDTAARLAWYGLNLASLAAGVWLWTTAWSTALARSGLGGLHRPASAWLALLAILLPLQTNFEHQNMNPLLLALTGGVAWALGAGRPALAGGLVGAAAALKAFPLILLVYLAARRHWRACAIAAAALVGLTALPLAVYGPAGFRDAVLAWGDIGSGGWPTRSANQSLVAAIDRLLAGTETAAVHRVGDVPAVGVLFVATVAALWAATRSALRRRALQAAHVPCELAGLTTLAVLLSPIAWDHYWVLLFPAFLLVRDASAPSLLGRAGTASFWAAAVLTTGIAPATVGRAGWSLARTASVSTLAAVILYCSLLVLWRRLAAASPSQPR